MEENVGQQIDRQRQVLVKHLGVVTGVFLGSKGIQHAADRVHFLRDAGGTALFGSFEEKVLDEMRNPVLVARLVTRPVLYPDSQANGAGICHLMREDANTVGQDRSEERRVGKEGRSRWS